MDRYAPLTKDIVCAAQTLYPNMGIEIDGMAIGWMPIPLNERYESFCLRLSRRMERQPKPSDDVSQATAFP